MDADIFGRYLKPLRHYFERPLSRPFYCLLAEIASKSCTNVKMHTLEVSI